MNALRSISIRRIISYVFILLVLLGALIAARMYIMKSSVEAPQDESVSLQSVDAASPTPQPTKEPPTVTPTPTATEMAGLPARITAGSMWVRSGPGTNYVMIGGVRYDDEVQLLGRTADAGWVLASQGWLFAEYVESDGDIDALPVLYDLEGDAPRPTPITSTPEV